MPQTQDSPLLQLPEVALEQIFSFLSFDEIARNRIICRKFNEIGGKLLTRGFLQLEKRNAFIYKKVKQALPRRESERKNHPLAKYCDVLQSVETRMSMLNMTYLRYIENQLVCFIPGKVLDETKRILDLVVNNKVPPKAPHFLQELRDLSSMAIEHFDEHILPGCREQLEQRRGGVLYRQLGLAATTSSKERSRILFQQPVPFSNELPKLKRIAKSHKLHITYLTQTTQRLCSKLRKQNIKLRIANSKLREQERKLQQQTAKISEQDAALTDIKKHIDEWEQKYKDFTTELIRARDDILHKASATANPILSPPCSSNQSPPFRSNIKPRTAAILPKNYLGLDLERKRKSGINQEVPVKRNRTVSTPPKLRVQDVSLNIPDLDSFKEKTVQNQEMQGGTDPPRGEEGEVLSSLLDGLLSDNKLKRKRKMMEEIDLK